MVDSVLKLKPFIPGGQDFDLSLSFFQDLGFKLNWQADGLAELQAGEVVFLLQDFHHQPMQENLMMLLVVPDLDRWYQSIKDAEVFDRYTSVSIGEPKRFPWGQREVHFIDPAGVCWHVTGP